MDDPVLGITEHVLEGLRQGRPDAIFTLRDDAIAPIVHKYMGLRPGAFRDKRRDRDDLVSDLVLWGLVFCHLHTSPRGFVESLDREANRLSQKARRRSQKDRQLDADVYGAVDARDLVDEIVASDDIRLVWQMMFRSLSLLAEDERQAVVDQVIGVRRLPTLKPNVPPRLAAAWREAIQQAITERGLAPTTTAAQRETLRTFHGFLNPRGHGNRDHQQLFRTFIRQLAYGGSDEPGPELKEESR